MTRSPSLDKENANKILGKRRYDHDGSIWDDKPMGKNGTPNQALRIKISGAINDSGYSYGKAAKMYGVSKSYAYKWGRIGCARNALNTRFRDVCKADIAFRSLSNRPNRIREWVDEDTKGRIMDLRIRFPFMGSAKIRASLGISHACSTIDRILRNSGLLKPGKSRRKDKTYGSFERDSSFDMVQIDYKSWKNGIHTMFVLDDSSRAILGYSVSDRQSADETISLLRDTFEFWRIRPRQILSDHGTEFYSVRGGKGRSKLSQWCREMDIELIHGRVRHPQTQGKIERSHRSAVEEISHFGPINTLNMFRDTMSKWVEFYNMDRPHQALGYDVPMNVLLERMERNDLDSFLEV